MPFLHRRSLLSDAALLGGAGLHRHGPVALPAPAPGVDENPLLAGGFALASEPGRGTTVILWLPDASRAEEAPARPAERPAEG